RRAVSPSSPEAAPRAAARPPPARKSARRVQTTRGSCRAIARTHPAAGTVFATQCLSSPGCFPPSSNRTGSDCCSESRTTPAASRRAASDTSALLSDPAAPDSNTSAGSPRGTAPGSYPTRSGRKIPSFGRLNCGTLFARGAHCTQFLAWFVFARFHPCDFDIPWLIPIDLFLNLQQLHKLADRHVFLPEILFKRLDGFVNKL